MNILQFIHSPKVIAPLAVLIALATSHCQSKLDPSVVYGSKKNVAGAEGSDPNAAQNNPTTLPSEAPVDGVFPSDPTKILNAGNPTRTDGDTNYAINSKDVAGPNLILSGKIADKTATGVSVTIIGIDSSGVKTCFNQQVGAFTACPASAQASIEADGTWTVLIPKSLLVDSLKYQVSVSALDINGVLKASLDFGFGWISEPSSPSSSPSPSSDPSPGVADVVAPTVTNVNSSVAAGTFYTGQTIPIQVIFSETIFVTGTPQLVLAISGTTRTIDYINGSGSNTLVFNYVVQTGDNANPLDYGSINALLSNGGTIKDASGNGAIATLAAPGQSGSLAASIAIISNGISVPTPPAGLVTAADAANGVDVRFDDDATGIQFVWNPATDSQSTIRDYTLVWYDQANCNGTATNVPGITTTNYLLGAGLVSGTTYSFKVQAYNQLGAASAFSNCSGGISIDTSTPSAPATLATAADSAVGADQRFDNDTTSIFFAWSAAADLQSGIRDYTVSWYSQASCGGIATDVSGIVAPNYTLSTGLANGVSYSFKVQAFNQAGLASAQSNCSGAITIDTTAPSTPAGLITAADSAVGADVRIDDDTTSIYFVWSAATDAQSGMRDYTVVWYNQANCGGTATNVSAITATNYPLTVGLVSGTTYSFTVQAFNVAGSASNSSSCSGNITPDTTAPAITSVTSSTTSGSYTIGATVAIQVVFDEVVTVTGTPQLTLATTSPDVAVNYVSGSGSTTILFNYLIASGHQSADLNYLATSSLALNGGTIRDGVGNNANLTLPALASGTSLAGTKDFVIDTASPNQPATMSATPGDTILNMTWTSGGGGESGYVLVRRTGAAVTWTPTRGATYSAGALDVNHTALYVGSSLAYANTGLVNGTVYYFSLFAYDAAKNYSAVKTVSATPAYVQNFVQVSSNYTTTCALTPEGKAWCWGAGAYGQLGNGTSPGSSQWVAVMVDTSTMTGETAFVQISTGTYSVCALTVDGKVWCWGDDDYAELGNGPAITARQNRPSPLDISVMTGEKAFIQLAVAGTHSCALTAEGKAWCWGRDDSGQLGNGATTADQVSPAPVITSGMTGDKAFVQIVVGNASTCGLTAKGVAWCWGDDGSGQLGNGAAITAAQNVPSLVDTSTMPNEKTFIRLAKSPFATCGITTAGKAWCWGSDLNGQLGNGAVLTANQSSPSPVDVSTMTGDTNFIQLTLGNNHTCGVTADGNGWCWGYDLYGRLGNGNTLTADQTSPSPVDVSAMTGTKAFAQLSGGSMSTCSLSVEGTIWCWGSNLSHQQGVSGGGDKESPVAFNSASVTGNNGFVQLATGYSHSCGLTSLGKAYCWGSDTYGQIGNGAALTANQARPSAVDTSGMTGSKIFLQLTVNEKHSCGLTSDGNAWCWGSDYNGQLGNGSGVSSIQEVPSAVDTSGMTGSKLFTQLVASFNSTCGLTIEGLVWCWGSDTFGQLGNGSGTSAEQNSPTALDTSGMTGETAIVQLAAGLSSVCGLTSTGKAWCWGYDGNGELGNGGGITGSQSSPSPVDVSGVTGETAFTQIKSGYSSMCALTAQGLAWCWGDDSRGQLGNGAGVTASQPSPYAVNIAGITGEKAFTNLAVGGNFSCGITSEGKLWCWGSDTNGRLGNGAGVTADQEAPYSLDVSTMTGGTAFASVVSNYDFACGLTAEGKAWCWGFGTSGQLGDGSMTTKSSPIAVDMSGL